MRIFYSRWQKCLALIALFVFSFGVASFAGAQETTANGGITRLPKDFIPPPSLYAPTAPIKQVTGMTNCFDYYHFGSVQVDMEGNVSTAASGAPMSFSGEIKNQNEYPIVDGAVYAKVFRKQSDEHMTRQNGNNLVDQFFVKENLSLPAKSETPLQFYWNVPAYAVTGDYEIAFFFTSAHKFNLLGLSFTDDVTGNTFNFSINGEQTAIPFLNKNTVKIDDTLYHFASFLPHQGKDENILITSQLTNPTDKSHVVSIVWKLYTWDAQTESNLLDTKKEDVLLNPRETRTLTYIDTKRENVVHLLVTEASYKDTKSILDIRYVRDGRDAIRLNFPSITAYPLLKDKEATIFSCFHNAGDNNVPDGKLTLGLKDINGKILHTYTYTGAVSGDMMAVKDSFTPKETLKTFSVEAKLWQDEKLVDEATMFYDCEKLGGKDCPEKSVLIFGIDPMMLGIDAALFIILLIALSLVLIKKRTLQNKRNKAESSAVKNTIKILAFAFLLTASWGLGGIHKAEAKSITWDSGVLPNLDYCWSMGDISGVCFGYALGLSQADVKVKYEANIIDTSSSDIINNGATVAVGTSFLIKTLASKTDISWDGTGHSTDTPYGRWSSSQAEAPTSPELPDYFVGRIFPYPGLILEMDVYIPLSVIRPNPVISGSDNLSCISGKCTVKNKGQMTVTVTFPATTGKFYYHYNIVNYCGVSNKVGLCSYYNKVPMVSSTQTNYSSYYICTRYDESYDGLAACTGNQIQPPYLLQVPAQSISFTLTATDPNHPPKDPTITPQTSNNFYKDSVQKFDISSIDPDGDTIKYCASWTQPGACEISSAYYSSGATWTLKKTFSDSGDHTLYVQATDSHGSKSGWSSRIFRIRGLPQNGACSLTTPHICTTEESTVTTNDTPTQYKWTCGGINGGNPSPTCVLNIPINAKCGGTKYSCQLGNPDTPYDSPTNYYWNCIGINNGSTNYCHLPKLPSCSSCTTDASCSLPITNSSCGTTGIKYTCQPGASYSTAPSTATDFLWRCGTESCSAPIPTCGMTAGSCPNGGTASSITASDTESNWICSLSGSTKSCSAPIIQPGNCGDVTYNTCDSGNPSGLAETNGYYTWICSGSSPQSCSLPAPVCDTSVEHTCRKGTPINIKDTRADYLWDCKLSGGVKSCTIAQSNCGTADNYSFATSDTGYGSFTQCRTGFTPSSTAFPDQGQSLTWICGGEKCRAGHNLDAVCGSQNGIPSLLQPSNKTSTSLCLKGSPPEFITKNTVTDKWEWECGGMLNGKSAPCSAPISHFKFWEF